MYSPRAAWQRALLWFALCFLVSWITGVLPRLASGPVPSAWTQSTGARALCLAIIAQWTFAYLYLWPRGTVTHGRPRRVLLGVLFGVLWGSAQSLLWLSVLALLQRWPLSWYCHAGIMFVLLSAVNGFWHLRFWDVRVSPAHNVLEWNARKVALGHAPFLVLTLVLVTWTGDIRFFVMMHAAALAASATAMRFPHWRDAPTPQHRAEGLPEAELAGMPRASVFTR
jgi:hypothetical protein